ncbi:hypothetical protein BDV98DRAFT_122174 [Pterulicium gracile]|uniref:DUF6534 domain-containing protein n=1 Tax=Pterulicium gracile TaxID=1884261 RepID=A0A5C3QDS4_9AGAR|nr:hypothetical protein BDV98DRAFT_122174 [Pterula gracilis]
MSVSTASDPPPLPENIVQLTASPLIGALLNWGLFGVLSVQVYIYHITFSDDRTISKALVYGVYLIEVVQTLLSAVDIYHWFGTGYGNMDYLMDTYTTPFNTPLLCGVVAVIVQFFFAYRIWAIQQQQRGIVFVVGGILITALVQLVGALMTAYEAFNLGRYDRFHESSMFTSAYFMWLLGDTISDLLIAAAMLWTLYSNRQKDVHPGTTKLLARVVTLAVETNFLTASVALLSFMLYVSLPHTSFFILTAVVMGKLYANTLLATFNNRIALREIHSRKSLSSGRDVSLPTRFSHHGRIGSRQEQKSSNLFNLDLGADAFGFGEDAHGGERTSGGKQDIEIEVLRRVEVASDTTSLHEGRQGPVCQCGAREP